MLGWAALFIILAVLSAFAWKRHCQHLRDKEQARKLAVRLDLSSKKLEDALDVQRKSKNKGE